MSKNGHLTADELTYVQFGITLRNDIAARYLRLVADAARDGVKVSIVNSHLGAGGYRSESVQLDMRKRPTLYNITPGILPGLPSEHGDGTCADIATGLAWVKEHQADYGITFPIAGDPNHARFKTISTAGTGTEIKDEDMPLNDADKAWILDAIQRNSGSYIVQSNTRTALCSSGGTTPLNVEQLAQLRNHYPVVFVGANERAFDVEVAVHKGLEDGK